MNGEWKTVELREVATIERSVIQPTDIVSGTRYLGLEHIESGGRILGATPVGEGELASSKFNFNEKHVLYGKLRPYLTKISCPNFAGICSTDILPILPGPKLDRRFLCYFLRQPLMVNYANSRAVGINLPRLAPSILGRFQIPLPPLAEQRRIADILDRAEALRAKRRAALAQLDSLTLSIFLDLFGHPVSNQKRWPLTPFSEVGTLERGISKHRPRNAPELLGGPYPLVQTGDVANCDGYIRNYHCTYSEIGLRQSRIWSAGTLCITIAANIAKTGILTFDACFPDSIVGFNAVESATVEYIRYWLSFLQKSLEDAAPESTQKNINLALLRGLLVPVPPLELQREFATQVAAVEKLKTTQRASLEELDNLFASLQYRAFRGEL
ncbi:MAG TPA: restriction endonuclease subunit S [Pyrinomonadaceae bacterium]|nr:restriction endonuclease subunit S [Pyrinomonadaceae bacterium]